MSLRSFLSAVVRPLRACHFVGDGGRNEYSPGRLFQFMLRQVSVAQRLVSAKPGLHFNPFLFSFFF